jgi:hypothetical protein
MTNNGLGGVNFVRRNISFTYQKSLLIPLVMMYSITHGIGAPILDADYHRYSAADGTVPRYKTISKAIDPNVINTQRYSEFKAQLKWWDLYEQRIGGDALIKRKAASSMRTSDFNNLYPPGSNNANYLLHWENSVGDTLLSRNPLSTFSGSYTTFNGDLITLVEGSSYGIDISGVTIPGYELYGDYHPPIGLDITYPEANYTLQTGSPFQSYDTLKGAFVFDMHLKKWGKYKWDYKALVPLQGINSGYSGTSFDYTDLGITAGLLRTDGLIYLFDHIPTEGFLRYGKMGYYRLGMVHFLETIMDFRDFADCTIRIDSSLDGRNLDSSVYLEESFTDVLGIRMYPNMRYRWYTITISGKYDLQYMEVRGNISARR